MDWLIIWFFGCSGFFLKCASFCYAHSRAIVTDSKNIKNDQFRLGEEKRLGGCVSKVLVAYYSDSGNTEKVAKAIYEEVSKMNEADLKKIKDIKIEDLNEYDLVFLGSPCHTLDLSIPVKKMLVAIPEAPKFKLAGFVTRMSPTSEKHSGYEMCFASF